MINKYLQYPLDNFWVRDPYNYQEEAIAVGTFKINEDVKAVGDGIVYTIKDDKIWTKHVHEDITLFVSLSPVSNFTVKVGDELKQGDLVGTLKEAQLLIQVYEINLTEPYDENQNYYRNPLTRLYIHPHQHNAKNIPQCLPRMKPPEILEGKK